MTPQLQQAIRLLQLSTFDLQQEIQEALDSNLMLEELNPEEETGEETGEETTSLDTPDETEYESDTSTDTDDRNGDADSLRDEPTSPPNPDQRDS